jgi:hypothetical protein
VREKHSRLARVERWVRARELLVRQLRGELPMIDEVERLVENHRANSVVGRHVRL